MDRRVFWPFLLLGLLLLPAQTSGPNQAALVIVNKAGDVETHCIAFQEEAISGYELLQRARLELAVQSGGLGTAICSINGDGCPANDCFCQCRGANCEYWSFWQWHDAEWKYATLGAQVLSVRDGVLQGWSWGPGSVTAATQPPQISFSDICAGEPTAQAEPVVSPTTFFSLHYASFFLVVAILGGLLLRQRRTKRGA